MTLTQVPGPPPGLYGVPARGQGLNLIGRTRADFLGTSLLRLARKPLSPGVHHRRAGREPAVHLAHLEVSTQSARPGRRRPSDIASNHDWYHTLELAPGVLTPGIVDVRPVERVPIPASLEGKRCLDIGTWDGFWAFEMERRGGRGARSRCARSLPVGLAGARPDPRVLRRRQGEPRANQAQRQRLPDRPRCPRVHGRTTCDDRVRDRPRRRSGHSTSCSWARLLLHLRDPVGALEKIRTVAGGEVVFNECIEYVLSRMFPRRR